MAGKIEQEPVTAGLPVDELLCGAACMFDVPNQPRDNPPWGWVGVHWARLAASPLTYRKNAAAAGERVWFWWQTRYSLRLSTAWSKSKV